MFETLPAEADDTEPLTARAWPRLSAVAVAVTSPYARTFESSMNARTSRPSLPPTRLRATEAPIESVRVDDSLFVSVDQAIETAPAWAYARVASVASSVIFPARDLTDRASLASVSLLALMNASVSSSTVLTAAAPARATLLTLPRARAPPTANASRIGSTVALIVMSPPPAPVRGG